MSPDERVRKHFNNNVDEYSIRYLDGYQQVCGRRMRQIERLCDSRAVNLILDVGCGAGVFSDLLLARFPNAAIVCLDCSREMLRANKTSGRKRLLQADCVRLPFQSRTFDLVNIDTVMHHLVCDDGYKATVSRIRDFLGEVVWVLRPSGLVAFREIYHESLFFETLHSRALYEITIRKVPQPLAKTMRRAGIQTTNVGVCFLSRPQWRDLVASLPLRPVLVEDSAWRGPGICYYRALGFRANGDLDYYLETRRQGN